MERNDRIVVNPYATTPSPNLGNCSQRGTWSSNDQVNECKQCVSQDPDGVNPNDGTGGKPWFYCDGSCMNQYEEGQCDTMSLVAKNTEQCESPCVQQGFPPACGDCSDNFDCPLGQECQIKDLNAGGMLQHNCGVCTPGGSSPQPQPTPQPTPQPRPITKPKTTSKKTGNNLSDTLFGDTSKTIKTILGFLIIILFIILIVMYFNKH
jgi:hypothetical protein